VRRNAFLDTPPPADAGLFGFDLDLRRDEIIVIGVPWEPTASYGRGSSKAPAALIPASHQLDLFDAMMGRSFGDCVGMLPICPDWIEMNQRCIELAAPIIDRGGIVDAVTAEFLDEVNRCSERLNRELFDQVCDLLRREKIVGVVGGDHSSPYGNILAHFQRYPEMGILHIDAHADLRIAYEGFLFSHASIMFNLVHEIPELSSLVSVGVRDYSEDEHRIARDHPYITTFYGQELKAAQYQGKSWAAICRRILACLPATVYVSFDVDGLEQKWCPHTGTPVPGGLDYAEAVFLLEEVVRSGRRIVGFDLCEVAPNLDDPSDEWDVNVGARLLHKLCCLAYLGR